MLLYLRFMITSAPVLGGYLLTDEKGQWNLWPHTSDVEGGASSLVVTDLRTVGAAR